MTDIAPGSLDLTPLEDWPSDAPDVLLGGFVRLSARVAPLRPQEDRTPQSAFSLRLVNLNIEGGKNRAIAVGLIGVLTSTTKRERIRVDVLIPMEIRRGAALATGGLTDDQMLSTYGPWARHMLYDFAASEARALAGANVKDYDLPTKTPRTIFVMDDGKDGFVPSVQHF